jgi:glycosyltransferase involved in cell wall biosynthesis
VGSTLRTLVKIVALGATLLVHLPLAAWSILAGRGSPRPGRDLLVVSPFAPGQESGGARAVQDFLDMLRRRYQPVVFVTQRDSRPWRVHAILGRLLLWPLPVPTSCQPIAAGDPALAAALGSAESVVFEFFATAVAFYLRRPPTGRAILRDHEVLVRKLAMERDRSRGLERLSHSLRLSICYLVSSGVYRRMDRIVTLTEEDRAGLLAWFPSVAGKTVVVPVPFDTPATNPIAPIATPVRDLLMLGNFFHRPNVDALLWFLGECAPHLPPGFTLHVCGLDRPLDAVRIPQDHVRVVRHGFVDDVLAEVPSASIAVAPVISGGGVRMKNLLLASMGKAIVTTPLGNEGIGFEDGRDAIVAATGAEMAARLVALADDASALRQLGTSARAFVAGHFSPEAVLDLVTGTLLEPADRR